MAELSGQVSELYSAYVAELDRNVTQLGPWWEELGERLGRRALKLRWPCGLASHPRILDLYRGYHGRIEAAQQPCRGSGGGPAPSFADDDAWGVEAEGAPEELLPIPAQRLLIDRLQLDAEGLYAVMMSLVMAPLGRPPDPPPTLRSLEIVEPDAMRPQAFHLERRHGLERGLERLMASPGDVRRDPVEWGRIALEDASEFHRHARVTYLRDLERALVEAEREWEQLLAELEARGLGREQALDQAFERRFAGPASHPVVVGVVQAYWALCEEINGVLINADQRVAPEQFLLGWLVDGRHDSWVELLSAWPYWPVGLDERGKWS